MPEDPVINIEGATFADEDAEEALASFRV